LTSEALCWNIYTIISAHVIKYSAEDNLSKATFITLSINKSLRCICHHMFFPFPLSLHIAFTQWISVERQLPIPFKQCDREGVSAADLVPPTSFQRKWTAANRDILKSGKYLLIKRKVSGLRQSMSPESGPISICRSLAEI
jgi:hypothetical protein